jgi:hypothetical protein
MTLGRAHTTWQPAKASPSESRQAVCQRVQQMPVGDEKVVRRVTLAARIQD